MKKQTQVWTIFITMGLLLISVFPAYAQSSTSKSVLHAEVDRNNISTDDTIILTVTVDAFDSGLSKPQLPALGGFQILGQNNGTQISMVNGDMTVQETYQFYLRPEYTGNLVIDPVTLSSQGTVYSTDPIIINVTQGTGKTNPLPKSINPTIPNFPNFPNFPSLKGFPSFGIDIPLDAKPMDPSLAPEELAGRDYFIEASADKSSAYQGEQIRYIVRFFKSASPIGDLEFTQPSFSGFWHKSVPEENHYSLDFGSKNYLVTEMQSILFPTVVGDIEIEPAEINIPGDFFSSGGTMRTSPVTLNIKPLPAGAPDSFNGAVGKFEVKTEVDSNEINVNEPVKYRLIVKGQGNVENIPEPEWNDGSSWRSFDTTVETSTQIENGSVVGTKVFERILVPTQSGQKVIPSLEFSYFDPGEGAYKVINSDQISIKVNSNGSESSLTSQVGKTNSNQNDLMENNSAISSIKTIPDKKIIGNNDLVTSPVFWILWTIPLLMLTGHIAWVKITQRREKDIGYRRYKNAAKKAHIALKKLERNPDSGSVERIILEYLSDKLNQPLAGLTLKELEEKLVSIDLNKESIEQIKSCIMLSDMGMYSPDNKRAQQLGAINNSINLIKKLEKEI